MAHLEKNVRRTGEEANGGFLHSQCNKIVRGHFLPLTYFSISITDCYCPRLKLHFTFEFADTEQFSVIRISVFSLPLHAPAPQVQEATTRSKNLIQL